MPSTETLANRPGSQGTFTREGIMRLIRVRRTGITLRNIAAARLENKRRRQNIRRHLSRRAEVRELKRQKILY